MERLYWQEMMKKELESYLAGHGKDETDSQERRGEPSQVTFSPEERDKRLARINCDLKLL